MIDAASLLTVSFGVCIAGIALAIVMPQRWNPPLVAWAGSLASILALLSAAEVLFADGGFHAQLWTVPGFGTLTVAFDRLSALFVFVAALVFLPTSVFSAGYLRRYLRHYDLKPFSVWYLALLMSIMLVLVAQDVLLFLLAWEAMSIFSYLLVNYEHEREANTRAGYLMLAMGEAGTLAAALALLLLAVAAGSLEFAAMRPAAAGFGTGERWAVFLLSFFGFGVKAGLVPVNAWLPRAHPAAPANVSAVLSAVILNLGLYGILRVNLDLLTAELVGTGLVVLVVGTVSAFVGILYATTENDLKVMLAHSSIENIGIVVAGIGAGLIFAAAARPALASIAFVAALYHMTNHSLYKALLFLGAGTVDYRAGTRDLDRLGGLIRRMPWTGLFFLMGALSISALPPFNGFASEWLTLQALLRSVELDSVPVKLVFALCGAGLALTAALALTCFVKAFAMGFLGMSRSRLATRAVEARASMLVPMGFLALLCLAFGVLPTYVIPAIDDALMPMTNASATAELVPPMFPTSAHHAELPTEFAAEFRELGAQLGQRELPGRGLVVLHRGGAENPVVFAMATSYGFVMLLLLLAATYGTVRLLTRARRVTRGERWAGGVARLLPEMTYTATGLSNPVRVVFNAVLRPRTVEHTETTVAQHFRAAIRRSREEVHLVDRLMFGAIAPWALGVARLFARMHHGRLNAYAGYVLVTLIVVLVVAALLARAAPA